MPKIVVNHRILVVEHVNETQPAAAQSSGVEVEDMDTSPGQPNPCNINPVPPPGQQAVMAKLGL